MARSASLPDPIAAGQALADLNDWRAIMAVLMFVIVALMGFIIWRELSLTRLIKAIDKMSAAMWAWRLALAEDRAERRSAQEERLLEQAERDITREEREGRL